jgi:hypothetical protein
MLFREVFSDRLLWLQLREMSDDPVRGLALFSGNRAQKNTLFRDFQNYLRQAKTYCDAATRIEGSAAALRFYYSALNLAKAELLQTHSSQIVGKFIRHGLGLRSSASPSIRGDRLSVEKGIFRLLYEKRVDAPFPIRPNPRVTNLLSLIPEIGMEVEEYGRARPSTVQAYHTIAQDHQSAWSLLLIETYPTLDRSEPTIKSILAAYDEVDLQLVPNWRALFAISPRHTGIEMRLFQSKLTYSAIGSAGVWIPDVENAQLVPHAALGLALSAPLTHRSEYVLTYTLTKTNPYEFPLDLVRYASLYYLSSLVRYKPSALDPVRQGIQAWLMDSFVSYVPPSILAAATSGITGRPLMFVPEQYRY